MSYQVTARKWRPMVFEDVIGQSHVTNTLKNALATNRLAHAFIFCGGRGCGKTTTARILAKAINCLHPKESNPCNECEVCAEITSGRSLDVVEIDGASNRGVDEIRNLRESVRYAPARGKYKVYIIDEVHMLTKEAFNALLKTLEEPPPHVLFIFATTEVHKVPATILSRCQRYDFRRITVEDIMSRLRFIAGEEKIAIDDDSLMIIAKKGDGSMRDSQSIFDQVVSYCGATITAQQIISLLNVVDQEFFFRVSECIKAHDVRTALSLVDEIVRNGFDIKEFLSGLAEHFRNMLIARTTGSGHLIEAPEVYRTRYINAVSAFDEQDILRLIKLTTDLESSIRYSSQPRFKLEVGIIQMTKMEQSVKIDLLLQQLDDLKKKLHSDNRSSQPSFPAKSGPAVLNPIASGKDEEVPAVLHPPAQGRRISEMPKLSLVNPKIDSEAPAPAGVVPSEEKLSSDEDLFTRVKQEWGKIVDEVRRKKISVGTILGESTPMSVVHETLHIASADDFHYSSLKRNQMFLTETVNGLLGTKLRIEPMLVPNAAIAPPAQNTAREKNNPPAQSPQAKEPSSKEHPLIETLYRDFGAERV
ncbi:MAG TPA: DNA polymerase III subunit gamma/tau [Bacteroidota bacterium]|nr:DNA polymerase III subunit gamma/tau [Bacteroidota bacterium]